MNIKLLNSILFMSIFTSSAFAGTSALTLGIGKTDFELITPRTVFTSADWNDLSLIYTNRFDNGGFFNIDYRKSLEAEHKTFSDDSGTKASGELDDTRTSITLGIDNFYIGYLQYSTDIKVPLNRTSGAGNVSYDLKGITLGLNFNHEIGDGHYFQYGAGVLGAEADLKQEYINSTRRYSASYDFSGGYFYGVGFSGPLGTSGIAYSLKYEVQKITFESYSSDVEELDDERSRISANLTYVFL